MPRFLFSLLRLLRRLVPKIVIRLYHFALAWTAAFWFRFPSRHMVVIGVTGTKGKSTTVALLGRILEEAGHKIGWTSSISLKIGAQEKPNPYHMTMLGRFKLQKLLEDMRKAGCQYAIIEVTSEGIAQFRHIGINFDVAVLTNLAREHIEAHGSFAAYQKAKETLFKITARSKRKIIDGQRVEKQIIVNAHDQASPSFIKAGKRADRILAFGVEGRPMAVKNQPLLIAKNPQASSSGVSFKLQGVTINSTLLGEFNLLNILASTAVARSLRVSLGVIQKSVARVKALAGRMEIVQRQPFAVVIDLAHTPDSFVAALSTIKKNYVGRGGKLIAVFGSAGGGRDKWKRPVLGETAARYCDVIILTNEDPYDEPPSRIIKMIASGITRERFRLNDNLFLIEDRALAITKAIELARAGDAVALLGKGTEATMVLPSGTIAWNEREVVGKALTRLR